MAALDWPTGPPQRRRLILAVLHATGSTAAAERQGDDAFLAVLERFYALVERHCDGAGGRVLKFMGDGALMVFPTGSAAGAIAGLRALQREGTAQWKEFGTDCRVQVKAGVGEVLAGRLGGRDEVIGTALNRLIKDPWEDFWIAPPLQALLGA